MDKETAKYMPYSGVAFPRLVSVEDEGGAPPEAVDFGDDEEGAREQASKSRAELDHMWMVGFLDHEKRTEKEAALKDLSHYVSMPGGQLVGGAKSEIRKIYKKGEGTAADGSGSSSNHEKDKRLKNMTAGARRRILGAGGATAARLTDQQILRLKELERTKGGASKATTLKEARRQAERRHKACMSVYKRENKKIRRFFKDKGKAFGQITQNVLRSRALEDLFELERDRLQAVLRIQEYYRTYRARQYWKLIVAKSRAVTKIQRVVRGMLARTLVRVWLLRRSWLVIVAQACIRGYLTRLHARAQLRLEQQAATRAQAWVCGYLARVRADFRRSWRAAVKIQQHWRGCVARVRCDRMWLDKEVAKMQKVVRGFLGRKRHAEAWAEVTEAAEVLQRNTRGMFGRWRRNELLWERETARRKEFLQLLRAEDEYYCELREKHVAEMNQVLELDKAIAFADKQWRAMQDNVNEKEFDFLAMEHERAIVDRRAIEQGWTDELDRYVTEHRQWVTNAKMEALFVGALYLRTLEQRRRQMQERLEWLEWKVGEIRRLRQEEAEELYQRETAYWWEVRRRERRRRVADQRRCWQVKWFTDDGKPDKKRRPGYAWNPRVYAGPERDVFNVGSVNLMAGTMNEDVTGLELITQQVALQNAQNQIVQYGSLLKPLFDGMEDLTEAVAQMSIRNTIEKNMRESMAADMAEFDEQDIDVEYV